MLMICAGVYPYITGSTYYLKRALARTRFPTFAGVRRANDWQSNPRTGYECRQHDRVDLRHFTAMNLGDFLTIHQHIDNVIDVSWWQSSPFTRKIHSRALPHRSAADARPPDTHDRT
jgi:hypothetical protein